MTKEIAVKNFEDWKKEQKLADTYEDILENYSNNEYSYSKKMYEIQLDTTMNMIFEIEKKLNDNDYHILRTNPKYSSKITYGLFDSKMKQIA